MKHAWERHPDSETIRRPFQRVRVRRNCKKEQTWKDEHVWGRVARRFWSPPAGRCKSS